MLSSYREAVAKNMIVDDEIKELVNREDRDFRVCTTCSGPVLIPADIISPKPGDIEIKIGENSIFVSENLTRYTRRIHKSLLDQSYWITEKYPD